MIERIQRVPLRKVWSHEAHDFTVWLQENVDVLTEIVGFQISNPEREQSTGNFNVDIRAEDESGDIVIIENQLEKSDHDHLGKIITYLSAFDAKKAIWITKEPRPEHINAISWLNEGGNGCDFWLLKIEAIQIGNSAPAPLISKIVGPSEEARKVGQIKKEDTERHRLRLAFWTKFLEVTNKRTDLLKTISPSKDPWIAKNYKKGFQYCLWVTKDSMRAELRIDFGRNFESENLSVFHQLMANKQQIEEAYGNLLEWNEAEGYRVCIIRDVFNQGGYRSDESAWETISIRAIDSITKLEKATKPLLDNFKI